MTEQDSTIFTFQCTLQEHATDCPVSPANSDIQPLLRQQQEAIVGLTLPQLDVPVFTGDSVEYCDFENLIEKKTRSTSTRLYYLLQYTSGQVQDLV